MSQEIDVKNHRRIGKASILPYAPAYTWGRAQQRIKGEYECVGSDENF
jgi:hypothetical protein